MISGKEKKQNPEDNILRITDELVKQVVRTKRLIILLIFTIVIVAPVFWRLSSFATGQPHYGFGALGAIPAIIVLLFLIVGIRQWFILSMWTKKYKNYKDKIESVDRQLDFEDHQP